MKTFHIMDEAGVSSYELDRVPAYKTAMKAFEEGIMLHLDSHELDEKGVKKGLEKQPTIIDRYGELKASRKVAKTGREDWEAEGEDLNADYRRVAAKKEIMAKDEANAGGEYIHLGIWTYIHMNI